MEKKKKGFSFYTKNLVPGKDVYGEKLVREKGVEYREWNITRSKLGAGLAKNLNKLKLGKGDLVLYLGASTGTTVSHISDIVGKSGLVFALEFAPRVLRELVFLAEKRKNIAPILADCNRPEQYYDKVCVSDFMFMDIAQRNQVEIFLKNFQFLKDGGQAILCVKARSIDVTKKPGLIFDMVKKELVRNKINIIDYKNLDPYEKDHCLFLCSKM